MADSKNEKITLETQNKTAADNAETGTSADVDAVMKKFDRESNTRIWTGWQKWAIYGLMAAVSVFVIYVTLFATWLDQIRYPSFVGCMMLIGYLIFPAKKGVQKANHIPWFDWIIMILGTSSFFYFVANASALVIRLGVGKLYLYEVIIGIIGILALLELCRRAVGIPILCVSGFFMLYALYYFLVTRGFEPMKAIRQITTGLFYNVQGGGILATPVQVCAKFIVVFIIFGAFLERTGISEFFINIANCLAGSSSGGPAKVAVISSALCGMVSGSSVGNTVTTGSVTIPMMKKTGYRGEFAGAVEAAASTGGQIMPPIMGAAAFLMAEYVGVPYSNIIVKAILPAFLYFLGIFIAVHLEAKKCGLHGIPRADLPKFGKLIGRIYLLLPLVVLVWLVSTGARTMAFAAAIAIAFAVAVSNLEKSPVLSIIGVVSLLVFTFAPITGVLSLIFLAVGILCIAAVMILKRKEAVMSPAVFFDALAAGAKGSIGVAVACGIAGIISGCITMTGLASKIISGIVGLSTNASSALSGMVASSGALQPILSAIISPTGISLFLAMFLTMLCCIILGMGVPTTANYCIMASTCAPILISLGINKMAAHFFVFYFGIVADITPPVALAAYAGAAIAKSNPMKTGMNAVKLAIAAFIVPYVFALNPAMLFIDTVWTEVALIVITSILGLIGVAAAIEGYFVSNMKWYERVIMAFGGLLMIYPGVVTDAIGFTIVAVVAAAQMIRKKRPA